jgi:hypothetical protein
MAERIRVKLIFRWPFAGSVATLVALWRGCLLGGIVGIVLEITIGIIIVTSLLSRREFSYDSFIGWLLTQYIVIWDPSILTIVNLVMARVFFFFLMLLLEPGWLLLIPALSYLLFTCTHIVPPDAKPMD